MKLSVAVFAAAVVTYAPAALALDGSAPAASDAKPAPAAGSDGPAAAPLERDERGRPKGSLVSVYVGLDVTYWGIEWGDSSDQYRGSLGGYDRETLPSVFKTLEVQFHGLRGLEGGLNYLTDSLTKLTGFSGSDTLQSSDDPVSRAITGYLHYAFDDALVLRSSLTFRRFESRAVARGRDNVGGALLAQSYLPSEGDAQAVQPGQTVNWFSSTRDLSISAAYTFVYAGYRNIDVLTPTDVFLVDTADSILVGTHNVCNAVEGGLWWEPHTPEPGWSGRAKLSVLWGGYSMHNSYFDTSGGYCTGLGAEIGAIYNTPSLSFEAGVHALRLSTATDPGGESATLKRDMHIVDLLGQPATYPAGTSVTISADRSESFWGPYVRMAWAM